jgi:GNAT superfamily N-acetyltransferase
VEIRPAGDGDVDALVPLYEQWSHPLPAAAIGEVLTAWSQHARAEILVAEIGGELAGLAAVSAQPHLAHPGNSARLVGLVVAESHRRRGVATVLLDAAEQQARTWGCDRMELTSSLTRDAAHRFYPARGYQETSGHHARYVKEL